MAIDLEHFPTNETALRMMERISPIYDRSYVGKWIFEIIGMEMGEARDYFEELRQQPFPERTTWAIGYWERRYAVISKPTDNLETRRRNIVIKRVASPPMNPARMEELVSSLTGGKTTVTENVDDYTFSVDIDIDSTVPGSDTLVAFKEIKKRKPSHQNFVFSVAVWKKVPTLIHLGSCVSTHVRFPVPEVRRGPRLTRAVRVGGRMAVKVRLAVPELA